MNLLVLESSTATASWAWLESGQTVAGGPIAGLASSALAAALAEHARNRSNLPRPNRILVGVGPGSFSGIRASIALAQGLARVWGCPVEPVRSSHAVAYTLRETASLSVLADAKRGQFFLTTYEYGRMTQPSHLIPKNELEARTHACARRVSCGPLESIQESCVPDAAALAASWLAHGSEPSLALEPIYLHAQVVATTPTPSTSYSPTSSS